MRKNIWSLVMAIVMVLTALPLSGVTAAAHESAAYNVQLTSMGHGEVTIGYNGLDMNWGEDCSSFYTAGSLVRLRARADDGYYFVGWFASPSDADPVDTTRNWYAEVNAPIHYWAAFAPDEGVIHTVVTTGGTLPAAGQTPDMTGWSVRSGSQFHLVASYTQWMASPENTADNWGSGHTFLPGHRYRLALQYQADQGYTFNYYDPNEVYTWGNYLQDIPSNRYSAVSSIGNPQLAYGVYTFLVPFSDVTDTSLFYYEAVQWLGLNGIVTGWADGSFRPMNTCNRAAVVTFLWRIAGSPTPSAMATFSDMTGNEEFDQAISWAYAKGIVTGWDDNTFRPWETCNRAAIVTFLYRYAKYVAGGSYYSHEAGFRDMTGTTEFDQAISWAVEKGIVTGWDDNTFRPWETCKRLAIASFLYRYAQYLGRV